jgi:radical SAM superfamily enzyme YgiQ (UPF0313 family)
MKILIIENVWKRDQKYSLFEKIILTSFSILPPLQARQIAAITPKKHSVHVLNERYESINYDEQYDLVNITFSTSTSPRAYEIADNFRKKGVTVVLSGMHPSGLPDEAKQHGDSVLLGRGELNWLELLEDFENNSLKPYYKPKKYTKTTYLPPTNIQLPGLVITGAIEATRGCPYKCSFCPEGNISGSSNYYARPIDDVIDEIKSIPQKTIMFYDASLTVNPEYTKNLFKKMKGLNKKFFCNGNSDVLANDLELVKLAKEAGCLSWLVGFESISQQTIELMGKNTNKVDEYHIAVKNIHDNKMAVIGDFIFGFDTDTIDVFNETLKMIMELKIDICDFCILTPFPGTPIFKQLEKEGRIITKDWSKYNLKTVVFQPKEMTPEELIQGVRKMYQNFYSNKYTIQRIFRSMGLGINPFFMVLVRNMIANMNSRRLFK